jgi:hypothetical protein
VRAADEYFAKIAMGKESALAICAMEKRPWDATAAREINIILNGSET